MERTVTINDAAEEVPHALEAVTLTAPLFVPTVAVRDVVLELPVQPVGKDQV
jgi:hypothetical protein